MAVEGSEDFVKLLDISITNAAPVRLFSVKDLTDVVVIAGPNGVGKTRLLERIVTHLRSGVPDPSVQGTVEATSAEEEATWRGKTVLDMSNAVEMEMFRTTLQVNRRRQNWQSSLINFESDRSIRNLQPLQFSWDMPDPDEEQVGWDVTFGFMRDRFQDTVHSMFRMIEAQRQKIANKAWDLQRQGYRQMGLKFTDPMEPFKRIFEQLLAPKLMVDPTARRQVLEYEFHGQVFDFSTLSSGEREVVNIAFDFLLRRPKDCIVFFDEPELHLHPELSFRLIQTLQRIGDNNQFFFSTHSPDVITASLDRSVIFLSPPAPTDEAPSNQAVPVEETDETHAALKLLGQSIGIVALGRRIVLIEGATSSLDKQTYGSIIKERWPELVLVPSGGKHASQSFEPINQGILSKSIWGVQFFMLCDRDAVPPDTPDSDAGRLRILPRYHLENFFLDEHLWAQIFASMEPENSWLRSPEEIRTRMREIAREIVPYASALIVSGRARREVGNVDIMPKGVHGLDISSLQQLFETTATQEVDRLRSSLEVTSISRLVGETYEQLMSSIDADTDDWKMLIPGKPLLSAFANRAGVKPSRAKLLYVNAAALAAKNPFADIEKIFEDFANA